jgi:hypothetical protein
MKKEKREEIIEQLLKIRLSGMFGDGLEAEYCLGGCKIKGLYEMTDAELLRELRESKSE